MFVVTYDFQHGYWTNSKKIKNSTLLEVPNNSVAKDEWFYDVPLENWKLVDLTEPF
jgi:hypothetical protein